VLVYLIEELRKRGIQHILAVTSRSKLRLLVPTIERWTRLDDGKLLGIKRGVEHNGVRTNLVVVKEDDRMYLYVSSYSKGARYVLGKILQERQAREQDRRGEIGWSGGRETLDGPLPGQGAHSCLHLPLDSLEGALREPEPGPEYGARDS